MKRQFKTVQEAVLYIEKSDKDWLIVQYCQPVIAKSIKKDLVIKNLYHTNGSEIGSGKDLLTDFKVAYNRFMGFVNNNYNKGRII